MLRSDAIDQALATMGDFADLPSTWWVTPRGWRSWPVPRRNSAVSLPLRLLRYAGPRFYTT
jgi:hypothetical protein